ncbi:hypothetical protein AAE026_29265 [Bradyrhizobium sp. DN5]|uniref:hypothetical protein n=1 Tax=Bradyrhizobium sp. DN5 TaxID=3056950 RepID=UPI003525A2A0
MKAIELIFKAVGAGAILVGSFLGALAFLDYRAQRDDAKPLAERASTSTVLVIDPPALRECDGPKAAKVTWNAWSAGVQSVKIFIRDKAGKEVLFTSGGSTGAATTAAWVIAGTTFILKDGYTLNDLASVSVGADKCR